MKVKSDPGIDPAEVLDLLGASSWFGALPPELQSLIIDRSVVRKYRRNQVIVRQDEPTRGMFCVLRGRVRGVNRLSDGSEVLVHIGELGSWFAVYSMLANDVSIGSVVADCPVTALNLSQPQFARIVRDEPSYYQYFARLLIEQFKMVFRYLGEVQGLEPEGWLLLRLRELVAVARRDRPGTPLANEIAVSQADLATMIGVSRSTAGRAGRIIRRDADVGEVAWPACAHGAKRVFVRSSDWFPIATTDNKSQEEPWIDQGPSPAGE